MYFTRPINPWIASAAIASILQPAVGYALYINALADPEAPGVLLAVHALLAQVVIVGNVVNYVINGGLAEVSRALSIASRLIFR